MKIPGPTPTRFCSMVAAPSISLMASAARGTPAPQAAAVLARQALLAVWFSAS